MDLKARWTTALGRFDARLDDQQPPFFATGACNNPPDTIPGQYDAFVRSYVAGVRTRF